MGTIVIVVILIVLVTLALRSSLKHLKGQGSCCGGGGGGETIKATVKRLDQPALCRKTLHIEGMHCKNCAARIQNGLNQLEGVAATVNFGKRTAAVQEAIPVEDGLLRQTVAKLGYQITEIETEE